MNEQTYEFAVGRRPDLYVRVPAGRLTLLEGDESTVRVEVRGKRASEFIVEQSGSEISVRYDSRRSIASASHDVEVTAPPWSNLTAQTASADVTVEGTMGEVRIVTASGDVRLDTCLDGGEMKTASGDVQVGRTGDRLRVRSASGDVTVDTADGDLSVSTAAGDVVVDQVAGDMTVKTASGECVVRRFDGSSISVKTVSGTVRIGLAKGRTVGVDLQSLTGRITLPTEPGGDGGSGGRRLRVKVRTVSGDVGIETFD